MSQVAAALSMADSISTLMAQLHRPKLLQLLGLEFDTRMVADIEGLHPVTLYQKSTLSIDKWKVPYVQKDVVGDEFCSGAYLSRFGHKTVALKCFETELGESELKCVHCEQLWAEAPDDVYTLTSDMEDAWQLYGKGERRAMKNWKGMTNLQEFYGDEAQAVKDILRGSKYEVGAQWPGIGVAQVQRCFLQDAGVLFADAGRSRNPYSRTAEDQGRIAEYAHDMSRLFLRIYATMKPEDWMPLVASLQRQTKLV